MRLRTLSACILWTAALAARGEEPEAAPVLEIPEPAAMTVLFAPFQVDADIQAIAWCPNGRWLAACDADANVTVWSRSDGGVLASWKTPGRVLRCLAWTDDGRVIAAGGEEDAFAWEAETGKELRRVHHGSPVVSIAFAPGTRTLISATEAAGIKRTDLWGTTPSEDIPSPASRLQSMAVSSDGYRLAVAGIKPQVAIVNLVNGKVELAFGPEEVPGANWICWGPRETTVLAHIHLGPLQEIDATTGRVVDSYSRPWLEESVALSASADGRQMAGVTRAGRVFARTRRSISSNWSMETPAASKPFIAVSGDGSLAAVPRGERRVSIVSMDSGAVLSSISGRDYPGLVAWSPAGDTLYVWRRATEVHAFNASTAERLRGYVAPGNRLLGLTARPDGAVVVSSVGGGWLRVTDVTSGETLLRKPLRMAPAYAQLSEDGGTFAWRESVDSDRIFVRDLLEPGDLPSIPLFGEPEHSLGALSPQGDVVVQLDWALDKLLYSDTTLGMPLAESGAPESHAAALRLLVSPDGTRTLIHHKWGSLDLLISGRPRIGSLKGKLDDLEALQYSPDGTRIAAVGDVCRILDASDLHEVTGFRIPGKGVALAWAPDGRRIAIMDDSGVTRIWAVPPPEPPPPATARDPHLDWGDLACQRTDRAFAAAQRLKSGSAETVAFLREKLAERENPEQIRRLIAQLRDESFARRQAARDDLHWMGVQAEPELLRAMTGEPAGAWRTELELLVRTAESRVGPSSQNMRRQHAMQILESIGSADAADALRHLSEESPSPRERQDAREAVRRLEQRPSR